MMLRRLMPTSLTLRIFLVLLLGVLLAAALTFGLAQRDRRHVIEHFHGRESAQRIADMLRMLATLPAAQRRTSLGTFNPAEWRLMDPEQCRGKAAPNLEQGLRDRLGESISIAFAVRLEPVSELPRPPAVGVRATFADGENVCLMHQGQRRMPPQIDQWRFPASLSMFVALIALVCWFAVRLALRPLQRMTEAAEAFGHDIRHPPLDTSGPTEVRKAALAFNVMQERVRDAMAERTQILAAVTHDLKTPLTRMRLRLESCGEETLKDKLGSDIAAMQRLVDEGLDLARSLESGEAVVRVDLDALLSSIADDAADAGQPVSFSGAPGTLADCQPNALRRAVENLVDNALKYGESATIHLQHDTESAVIRVCDHGPGIPEERLADVLRPFVRLEISRSRESGGTGLGLAIASNLLTAQGGNLTLSNLPHGGLEARVTLPLAKG